MLREQVLPAFGYAAYAFGWRRAPRLLSLVEAAGHRLRNRELAVELHHGEVGGRRLRVRVIAWDRALAEQIRDRVGGTTEVEGTMRALDLVPSLRGADLTFVEVPEFRAEPFVAAGYHAMPKRVAHVESLDRADPPIVRRIRRGMRERALECTLTRDPRALARFVDDIYRPFVAARHAARARPTPELVLQLVLLRGRLLEVREAGRVVAGALVARGLLDRERLEIVVIGARDPNDEIGRTAPVVFARDLARREGFARCDHLGSAPFLTDGIFRRKRRYGTVPLDMAHRKDRVMVDVSSTAAARAFVAREPFLVLDPARGVRSIAELVTC